MDEQIHEAIAREMHKQQSRSPTLGQQGDNLRDKVLLDSAVPKDVYSTEVEVLKLIPKDGVTHHNLPPRDYGRFVGRQHELDEVQRLLRPYPKSRHHLVTIDGIGGIGKSALALETAYTFRDYAADLPVTERFEAIVWVSAKRTYLTADGILEQQQAFRTLDDLYVAIAQVLDYPAITRARAEDQRAIVEHALSEQRTLLIIDNLETVDDEELLVFLRLLPDPTKAIVTTRHRIDVAYPVRLTGMPHADAHTLIIHELERKMVQLTPDKQEELWKRTGGVPLAMVWSIGLMGLGGSAESVLRRLGSGQSDIARFCFDESVGQIRGRDAHYLLLALSLFATQASREALGVVAELAADVFGRDGGLAELLRLSLVNKEGEYFSLLPLTRSFVQAETKNHQAWMADAQVRWRNYFYDIATNYGKRADYWEGHDTIERELPNIFAVIDHLTTTLVYETNDEGRLLLASISLPHATMLLKLIDSVAYTCRIRGFWNDCERLDHIAITIGKEMNDESYLGWRQYDLGRIFNDRGDLQTAQHWLKEALGEWQRVGATALVCHAQRLLGFVLLRSGEIPQGLKYLTSAKQEYQQWNAADGLPYVKEIEGRIAEEHGSYYDAYCHFQEAVDMLRRDNNSSYLPSALLNLGRVAVALNDIEQAQRHYNESLQMGQENGTAVIIAKALYHMAMIHIDLDQLQSVEADLQQAARIFRRMGLQHEQNEAQALLTRLNEKLHNRASTSPKHDECTL